MSGSGAISEGEGRGGVDKMDFALRLKLKRIQAGLRQRDVARRAGLTEMRVCRLETGRATPKQEEIERLRAILGEP